MLALLDSMPIARKLALMIGILIVAFMGYAFYSVYKLGEVNDNYSLIV